MQPSDALVQEVIRRARVLRARQLRKRKRLLSIGCIALSLLLVFLLHGKTGMTVAANTEFYGSLVFEGYGSLYIIIAVSFFLAGILAGLGLDALRRRRRQRRIQRYTEKWVGKGGPATPAPKKPQNP